MTVPERVPLPNRPRSAEPAGCAREAETVAGISETKPKIGIRRPPDRPSANPTAGIPPARKRLQGDGSTAVVKRVACLVGVVLGLYLVAAVVAGCLFPERIRDAERRLFAVRVAIAELTHDQQLVQDRMRTITDETLGRGKSKLDEVSALLADPDLNRLALTYTGADWSLQRSALLGRVAHARESLALQEKGRENAKNRLNEKIKELEARKRTLLNKMRTPRDEQKLHVELDDIERQLLSLQAHNSGRERIEKGVEDLEHIESVARNEDAIFRMASDCQTETIGRLRQVMADRLASLRWEEDAPTRLRRAASWFNVWPVNLVLKLPEEGENEK